MHRPHPNFSSGLLVRLMPFALVWAIFLLPAFSQSTLATITGAITDQQGAAMPSVTIEAVHVETGYRFNATSNEVGLYTIPQLPQGEYTLQVKAEGFQESVVKNIILVPRDVRRIDVQLSVASVQATVEVTAGATLIETETARLADTKSGDLINSLPYGGRGAFTMFQMTPNVTRVNGVYMMRFAGSRLNQSDYSVDGVSFMVSSGSNPNAPLVDYTETVEEMRVDVANNTAEFGTVGQVSMISKSGTNELHGSVADFYSSPFLRTREPFALARNTGIQNKPSFTLGGPVYIPHVYDGRNKTFFFTSVELGRFSNTSPTLTATVPTSPWRSGNFAGSTAILDPMAGRTPFANNVIPQGRLNPVSLKIQERFYPLPNIGDPSVLSANNFKQVTSLKGTNEWYYTERVDHRIADKVQLSGRMVWHGYDAYRVTSQLGGRESTSIKWKTRFYTFSYTHTLRPTMVNEFRWGSSFNVNPRNPMESGLALVNELGLQGLSPNLPDLPGIFNVSFSGLGLTAINNGLQYRDSDGNENFYFQDHLSWFHGRHSVKVGGQYGHAGYDDRFLSNNLYGAVTFTNRFTAQPYADFLLGMPSTSSRAPENMHENVKRDTYSLFVTDEFRYNNQLTLNLGLRYEYAPGWYGNTIAMFDPGLGKIVVPDDNMKLVSPLVPANYVEVISASEAGLPTKTLLYGDRNNFAPRIGVAWRPFGPNTVLRAGYGLYYDLVSRNLTTAGGSPYSITEPAYTNPQNAPTVIFPRVFPESGTGGPSTISIPGATNPHVRTPYTMQYNFTVEHQRWNMGFRASYIGTNTRQGEWSYNMNQPLPDTQLFIAKAQTRLFPKYPNISYYTNGAGHQYHSLTLQAVRRTKGGLFLQTYYTLARDIGDLDRGQSPENAYDRQRERGVWIDIPTHRWNATVAYELPFGKGKQFFSGINRWQNLVVGGWEINGVYTLQSGDFLTPLWTGPDPTGTAYTTSSTPANVTIRPDQLYDPNLPSDQRTLSRWFDLSAFAAPQAGSFGTSARGVIKGPGTNIMHATIGKSFAVTERVQARVECAATNALNHPNWSAPGVNISSLAAAGVITGSSGNSTGSLEGSGSRTMMLRVRVKW